ncbi:phage holin family protein [Paenibacillus sp. AGC30]
MTGTPRVTLDYSGSQRKMRSPFYIANELLCIIENGGKLGAPIKSLTGSALNVYL